MYSSGLSFGGIVRDQYGNRARRRNDRRPPCQDQERGLVSILGEVPVADDAPTHAEDHRPMSGNESSEGRPVALRDESVEQFGVRCAHVSGRGEKARNPFGMCDHV
jgi:hypothetical protein